MIVKNLESTPFEALMKCFLLAFDNYFVKMPTDYEYYKERWKAAGVNYTLSYGMFDDGLLVGFIINAIDERNGETIAYNTGTGVIPKYRGQRIVKRIYEHAIPDLKKNNSTKCLLEVITENDRAIKSYEGIGFKICKHYKCFKGEIKVDSNPNFELNKVEFEAVNWELLPNQELYSWDNQSRSLYKGSYNYYEVEVNKKLCAFFVIKPESGYVAQLDVLESTPQNWNLLFSALQTITKTIRINNIDDSLTAKIRAIETYGLENTVNQYEMEMPLNT